MSLQENTSYSNPIKTPPVNILKSLAGVAYKVGDTISKSKKFDTSAYSDVVNNIGSKLTSAGKSIKSKLGSITTPYGGSTRYESFHPGVDIANDIGTNIPTPVEGKVTDVVTGKRQGDNGFGNYVVVQDRFGNKHRFSHLLNAFVMVGQNIPKGSVIGAMGNSGQTYSLSGGTGSHLDYRIQDMYGRYINPTTYKT
jgi:murein DD-endopeptidase MepM/ murein hydrolase activator NlpD